MFKSMLHYFQPESFYSLLFTSENMLWRTNLSPEGELKKWLLEDKRAPVAAWAPEKAYGIYLPDADLLTFLIFRINSSKVSRPAVGLHLRIGTDL